MTLLSFIIPTRVLASWKGKNVLFFNYSSERIPERVRESIQSANPGEGIEIRNPQNGAPLPKVDELLGQFRVNGVIIPKSNRDNAPDTPYLEVISWKCRPQGVLLEVRQPDGSWTELE